MLEIRLKNSVYSSATDLAYDLWGNLPVWNQVNDDAKHIIMWNLSHKHYMRSKTQVKNPFSVLPQTIAFPVFFLLEVSTVIQAIYGHSVVTQKSASIASFL